MATRMTKPIKCEPVNIPYGFHEEWKDIKGYEGLYKISNCGRVYSLRQDKLLTLHRSQSDYVWNGFHTKIIVIMVQGAVELLLKNANQLSVLKQD